MIHATRFRKNHYFKLTKLIVFALTKALIEVDSMHESYNASEMQNFFKNRVAAVPISETLTNRSALIEVLKHINMIITSCKANNYVNSQKTPSIEEFLHDIGAISMISSTDQVLNRGSSSENSIMN